MRSIGCRGELLLLAQQALALCRQSVTVLLQALGMGLLQTLALGCLLKFRADRIAGPALLVQNRLGARQRGIGARHGLFQTPALMFGILLRGAQFG